MNTKTGNLSIDSENMFPIIKKWLYSDRDIFVREMVSNGCDAITKLHKLSVIGEYEYPEGHKDSIQVVVDPEAKTVSFTDTGLGMTADEVEEYITRVAFSGATQFIEKYKDKAGKDDIIGHFGLGFYSAFMVSDLVEIDTLSYLPDSAPVHWECDGGAEYQIGDGTRKEIGTTITLHLNEDSLEFANEYRMREVLEKYCGFMPVEIFLTRAGAPQEYETIDESDLRDDDVIVERIHEDAKTEEKEDENGNKQTVEVSPASDKVKINKRPVSISDTHPLWTKSPSECTDEEYKSFYRKVFNDYREPLFWIHLNMDYPFNLKGILYFPKINLEYESIDGTIKLYNNQVFVADNIKEVIPEYLMVLRGVIDCPDFPLNVSRSALQNDGFVKKISDYIAKKVADKLTGMCKTDRATFEKYWDDISPFIEYGCLKDEKFSEKLMDYVLYKDINGKYSTLPELLEAMKAKKEEAAPQDGKSEAGETKPGQDAQAEQAGANNLDIDEDEPTAEEKAAETSAEETSGETPSEQTSGESKETADAAASDTASAEEEESEGAKEPPKDIIYYVTDENQQSQYIRMFKENGLNAVVFRHNIDSAFITHVEQAKENVKFERIDAEVTDSVREDASEEELKEATDSLTSIFRKALNNDKLEVKVEKLKNPDVASMLTLSEESRRMQEMMKMYNMYGMDESMFAPSMTLILNANNQLVQYIESHKDAQNTDLFCQQLYDLALMSNKPLSPEEMTRFISRSNQIMMMLARTE